MISADTKAVLLADAVMFLLALLLGVWKYNQIATSEDHSSHSMSTSRTARRCSTASRCC